MRRVCIRFIAAFGMLGMWLLAAAGSQAAEIGLSRQIAAGTNPPITVAAVVISGQIVAGDAAKTAALLAEIRQSDDGHQIRRLLIHSPGGLAGEAMEIGRMLRANGVEVYIPANAVCISACVFILAGGASRTVSGRVGIDLPHFLRAAGPGDNVPALLAESKQSMQEYFKEMGVDQSLADAMFALTPGVVRFLNKDELVKFGLG